jgi:Fis family transcriptional regulator
MTSKTDQAQEQVDNTLESVQPADSEEAHQRSLREHVTEALKRYFDDLDGQETRDVYNIVMNEVEPPLLEAAMKYTRQNQSKTAELLGLNRGTLRKKLKQYNLL